MRLRTTLRAATVAITATALIGAWATTGASGEPAGATAPIAAAESHDQYIVGFSAKSAGARTKLTRAQALRAAAQRHGVTLTEVRELGTGAHLFRADRTLDGPAARGLARALMAGGDVDYVEPDARMYATAVPNDTRYADQWHYFEQLAGMNLPGAWDSANGTGVVAAVIDTGRTAHSDLDANTIAGYDFISDSANARDGNGRDSNPQDQGDWNATDNECYTGSKKHDSSWHGTHVAGTIAAVTNNASGVAGVAGKAKVQHLRVLGKCGGSLSDIADAIVWAAGGTVSGVPANPTPAKVINMSLGGSGTCGSTYQNAINSAVARGSVVVVAAGNANENAGSHRPANCNNVITVAASDRDGNRAFYSNYGSAVDITAPGGETRTEDGSTQTPQNGIWSTMNDGATTPGNGIYKAYMGTSMATPHIAGLAALMLNVKPALTPADIESIVKSKARLLPGTCSGGCGAGLADATATINSLLTGSDPDPVTGQLLNNPGFESGNNGAWAISSGVIDNGTTYPARTGSWKAWLGGYGSTHTDTLAQSVTIPSGVTSATLTFWVRIDTRESTTTQAYDTLKVQVLSSTGSVLTTLATYSNLNKSTGYVERGFNLTSYRGMTVSIRFLAQEDSSLATSFLIDDTALTIA